MEANESTLSPSLLQLFTQAPTSEHISDISRKRSMLQNIGRHWTYFALQLLDAAIASILTRWSLIYFSFTHLI